MGSSLADQHSGSSWQVPVTCNKDCGGGCPLMAHVENGRLVRISNSPFGTPYMRGCVRGFQMPKVVYAPDRITTPLWRDGPRGSGQFRPIGWDEALDRIADRLADIRSRHGAESILRLGGSGACRGAVHNTSTLSARFLGLLGPYTRTYSSYSSAAVSFVTPYVFGTSQVGIDPATLLHAKLIILWGANIVDLRFGCETEAYLRAAKEQGTPIIVIDPRRSRTVVELGTQWIAIRPGTDTAVMLAVLYVLIQEGLVDRSFLARHTVGFEQMEAYVLGRDEASGGAKTPEWAERISGVPAPAIAELARAYGRAKPTALVPGLSIQRNLGGEDAARMCAVLQAATGNVGVLGGSAGGITWSRLPGPRCGAISSVAAAGSPAIPVYRWADAILEGKAGGYPSDIRAIYNVGTNYLSQGSDVHKNIRAFEAVEFAVCHDYFLTPTACYCDVVLPTTTFLERDDIVFPGGNYLLYSNKAIEPPAGARHDYDILSALADRLGFGPQFSEGRTADEWLQHALEQSEVPDYKEFERTGIYMGKDQNRVGLADFVANPVTHPLPTPSGKIEIASHKYAADTGFPSIPTWRDKAAEEPGYPLQLITPHSRYHTHSQCYNIPACCQHDPQALWINSNDAAERGISDGGEVEVSSPQGRTRIAARVTADILSGVVWLLEGTWPKLGADGVDRAGSPNVLTSTVPTEPSKGSRTHSVWVQVRRAAQD